MAATLTELRSSFLQDELESERYKSKIKDLQDWLTGQTQVAQQQYQATAQTAAQQASYDISGAYANYLKQQRAIASQGQLETGYKEEVGEILGQQYGTAYQQARTTQAKTTASAAEAFSKNVAQLSETATKASQSYYESAIKEAELRANIYRAAEEYAGFTDESEFPLYDIVDDRFVLTDYGLDKMSSKLLDEKGGFKTYLEEQGLQDELEYYLSDVTGLHEMLFGITDTEYDSSSEESYFRRMGAMTADGKTSYIDTLKKPSLELNFNDFATIDFGQSGYDKFVSKEKEVYEYATETLGLTDEEIKDVLNNDVLGALSIAANNSSSTNEATQKFNEIITKLDNRAKIKYIKE